MYLINEFLHTTLFNVRSKHYYTRLNENVFMTFIYVQTVLKLVDKQLR